MGRAEEGKEKRKEGAERSALALGEVWRAPPR